MSEIKKIPKNPRRQKVEQPKVLGGTPLHSREGEPKVLDQRMRAKPVEIQTNSKEEVHVESHVRSKPKRKSDPDVRLRIMPDEDREAFEKVKRNEWEPE